MSLPSDLAPGELLTDDQVEEIRRDLEGGLRGNIVAKWVRLLLQDREEWCRRESSPD